MNNLRRDTARYAVAILAAVIAILLRKLLDPLIGPQYPYNTMFLAVVVSAWYGGIGPAIASMVVGAGAILYWFVPPYYSFAVRSSAEAFGLLVFLLMSAVIAALGESTRRQADKRESAEVALRESEARTRFSLEAANVGTWEWDMTTGNVRWSDNMERIHGQAPGSFGGNFESFVQGVHPEDRKTIPRLIQQAIAGDGRYSVFYRQCRTDGSFGWMEGKGQVFYDRAGKPTHMRGVCTDVTERKQAEDELRKERENLEARIIERTSKLNAANRSLRELSGRLMQIRDDESRRLARELHDSIGQLLAALSMNNAAVGAEASKLSPEAARAFSENVSLVNQISAEIRTISHLLHPPLLDEAGLPSALRWYVDGFSERSRIKVDLEMCPELARLPKEVEISIFRTVQECLTNIHKHSDSPTATIRVIQEGESLRLEIEDAGKGIPPEKQSLLTSPGASGVGVSGMRERLRQLGGSLEIQSDANGTRVTATLPVESQAVPLRETA
jgi:PAS domain S-box-containing protein